MATATKAQQQEALDRLHTLLHPGDTVYTNLKHVSRSGMYRVIDLYVIRNDTPLRLSWSVGAVCEGYDDRHEGAKASGCGMDMGFHLVYNTSTRLFPSGFECVGESCPSNDHTNGDRDYSPHHHRDGGYALVQRWL